MTILDVRFYLGFIANPKNARVKGLSKACLDRTYLIKTFMVQYFLFWFNTFVLFF